MQLEAALGLMDLEPDGLEFCALDARGRRYERVAPATVLSLIAQARGHATSSAAADANSPARSRNRLRLSPDWRPVAYHLVRAARSLKTAAAHFAIVVRHLLNRQVGRESPCESDRWSSRTTYCSVGLDMYDGDVELLAQRKRERGFRVVLTVYDLIPVVRPQYFSDNLGQYFACVIKTSDELLTISRATESDLRNFAQDQQLPVPPVTLLPIGSELVSVPPCPPDVARSNGLLDGRRFILCVGTVEIRKNHHLLFDVWEMLHDELGPNATPTLVIAGNEGWSNTETMARLAKTPSFEGVIVHLEDPTDAELSWLYSHCAFTVFPSRFEGWGLPVAESLDFSKLCITGDGSSLPEVGEGLTVMLDARDRNAWKEAVLRYWEDDALLRERGHKIGIGHQHVTPRETARVLMESASRSESSSAVRG